MKDSSYKQRFVELRAAGKSFAAIAEEISVSKPTLIAWSRELGEQVQNLRAINDEALIEKYRLTKEREIKALSSQLDAVEKELASRSLSDVPTEKLYSVLFRLMHEARREYKPLTFTCTEYGTLFAEGLANRCTWIA